MKIFCEKNVLLDAINIVQKAVSPKSTLPILEGILLEASENLKLTGNDLELGIECEVEAKIEQTGSIVLDAKMFGDIVRKLPNDTVYIEVQENNSTYIKCGNSEFNIMGITAVEFPELPKVEKENSLVVCQEKLRSMIRQTIFAVGTNTNKLIFTGSCVEVDNNELNMVSVDGYRLALRKEPISKVINDKLSFVIPGKTLNELSKIIRDEEKDIQIYVTNKHVLFEFDHCLIVSRLLEGEFLNYQQIIPKEHQLRVKASVKPLIDSIERAALIITSENKKYPVKLNITMDKMLISCMTETGKVQDSVPVETLGNDLEIGFNHKYLLDALKACECDEVYLEFNTALNPCVIKPIEGEKFIYLVLPVRLRGE
ncbi:MAG: polymerase subunit beta [Clostridiales bacterium]|jgi:DNA polymerase-3 subunit beta|nr:polymerase subunit beta [Clostridiales bacterium]